jgi:hypothetical protein
VEKYITADKLQVQRENQDIVTNSNNLHIISGGHKQIRMNFQIFRVSPKKLPSTRNLIIEKIQRK